MARLIDADTLPNELFKKHVHDGEELEPMIYFEDAVKVVENAPTIGAIPVEWLKQIQAGCACDTVQVPMYVAIGWLIDMWQKEQEAQDE